MDGADPGGVRGDEICGPKPHTQRRVRILHDGACREPVIALALATPQDVRRVGKPIRLARLVAPDTAKTISPADRFEIGGASQIIVALGINPISMFRRSGRRVPASAGRKALVANFR